MVCLDKLNKIEIDTISKCIADAFYDYEYNLEDEGLISFINTRERMYIYIRAIVEAAARSGILYTTSDKQEGYLIYNCSKGARFNFIEGLKMIHAEKKALGGFRKMKEFIKCCWAEGGSLESKYMKTKRDYIKIEVLVVRKEYQHKGFMRRMIEDVYKIADEENVSVILDTDDKDKALRYQHLGMNLVNVRKGKERFHMYDLVREQNEC